MSKKEERMRQVRRQKMILLATGIGILLLVVILGMTLAGNKKKEKESKPQEKKQEVEEKEEAIPKLQVDLGSLYSENAILIDEKTGKTIAGEKQYEANLPGVSYQNYDGIGWCRKSERFAEGSYYSC